MKFRMMRFAATTLVVAFFIFAAAANAGTVTGTVKNGTSGQVAAGVDMLLIQLQGGMQPVAETKTDAQGHFSFTNPTLGTAPMLIRAVYRGVNYHQPVTPGQTTADVEIFEPTDKAGAFSVTAHAIIVQPSGGGLSVGEEYDVTNKTQPPVAYYRADGSFVFSIPEGAQLGDISASGTAGMPVVQTAIDKGNNKSAIAFAFRPGDSNVRISYGVPYPNNQTTLKFVSPYAVDRIAVFAPPQMQVTGDGFSPSGQTQGFNVYMRQMVAANTTLSVSISGTAPAVAPQGGADNGAADNSQNPSVNSRADSGTGDAPLATATALPARLDSLKWIVVAGFAAIFALGLAYVWRRPQVQMAAGAEAPVAVAAVTPAPVVAAATFAAPPAPAAPAATVASVTQEVRGSLDELKDMLFRLELRRQAGTIGEEEYAREHARIEQTLRNLVKG